MRNYGYLWSACPRNKKVKTEYFVQNKLDYERARNHRDTNRKNETANREGTIGRAGRLPRVHQRNTDNDAPKVHVPLWHQSGVGPGLANRWFDAAIYLNYSATLRTLLKSSILISRTPWRAAIVSHYTTIFLLEKLPMISLIWSPIACPAHRITGLTGKSESYDYSLRRPPQFCRFRYSGSSTPDGM